MKVLAPPGSRPTKEMVRAWLVQRRLGAEAPPGPEEIRKALNWTTGAVRAPGPDRKARSA
jgi:hypothetical protein